MNQYWKLSFTCISLALALTLVGCGSVFEKTSNLTIGEGSGSGELVSQEKKSFAGDQYNTIDIVTDAMEIIVKQGDGEEATVELLKDSEISNELSFDASIQGGNLQVTVTTKEKLFSVGDQSRGERRLIVTLPEGQEPELNIANDFGRVELDHLTVKAALVGLEAGAIVTDGVVGELDLNVEAGSINVKQASPSHSIFADAETGDIEISFAEEPANASFDLQVEVGKVQLNVDDVSYEEQRNTIIRAERGNDGPNIKATSSLGSIRVNG